MSYSTLKFYKNTPILPNKNFMVDDIAAYLATYTSVANNYFSITEFQYIKHSLNLEIKIDSEQFGLEFLLSEGWNYMSIQNSDTNSKVVYYFIVAKEWKAQETIKLTLYLDTLNTFKFGTDYTLSDKTKVIREHKDRFKRLQESNPISYFDGEYKSNNVESMTIVSSSWDDGSYISVIIDSNSSSPSNPYDKDNWIFEFEDLTNYTSYLTKYPMIVDDWQTYDDNGTLKVKLMLYVRKYLVSDLTGCQFALKLSYKNYTNTDIIARNIDYFNEGLNPILYKKEEFELNQNAEFNTSWNLLYKGSSDVSCYLIPENEVMSKQNDTSNDITIQYNDLDDDKYYLIQFGMNGNEYIDDIAKIFSDVFIEADGIQYNPSGNSTFGWKELRYGFAFVHPNGHNYIEIYSVLQKLNRWTNQWEAEVSLITSNISSIKILNRARVNVYKGDSIPNQYTDSNIYWSRTGTSSLKTIKNINQIDRTDSTLIKIIKLPYAPENYSFDDVNGLQFDANKFAYDSSYNSFKLISNYTELTTSVATSVKGFYQDLFIPIEEFTHKYTYHLGYALFESIKGTDTRNIKYESKLYHSSFYQKKFVYDSFSFIFQEEKIDVEKLYEYISDQYTMKDIHGVALISPEDYNFSFVFTATKTINSKFMFSFPDYILKMAEEDYEKVLPVARNNEEVIYNSDYINYLRTAYNYDLKAKERTEKLAGIDFAVSTGVGAIRTGLAPFSLGASTGTSLVKGLMQPTASTRSSVNYLGGISSTAGFFGSTISGMAQLVNTIAQAEDSIERKIASLKAQAVSVSGSDDIDLLKAYSNNKAKLCTYQASDRVRGMLFDLFHFTGYATGEMKVPNLNSRYWFNFIQADIVFMLNKANIPQSLLDNIAERFMGGVTNIHHRVQSFVMSPKYWDFEQEYENWELSLVYSIKDKLTSGQWSQWGLPDNQ